MAGRATETLVMTNKSIALIFIIVSSLLLATAVLVGFGLFVIWSAVCLVLSIIIYRRET